ncbi:MAG: hypothetical protein GY705_09335 [Bacteroidetes bacterium]|nr:hypothetical protein [Bacteroidota bacterium]
MMKEEFKDTIKHINKAIANSAAIAIAESKALKLPITYLKENQVITEYPDGSIEVLETLDLPTTKYEKGQKLYVREKN